MFGFFTGAVFFQLPFTVSGDYNLYLGSILWITLMYGWVNVFKVYHINRNDKRMKHEISNNKYSPLNHFLADFITSAIIGIFFIPVGVIAYFMMGYSGSAYPFLILDFWFLAIVSEAMMAFICKFSTNPTVSMVFCQVGLIQLFKYYVVNNILM